MALTEILGEITQGHGAGLKLLMKDSNYSSIISPAGYLYDNLQRVDCLVIAGLQGFFKKVVEKEVVSFDDVAEIKKINEVGNTVFYQIKYTNGEASLVKTYINLDCGQTIQHPASALVELLVSKLVQ